MNWRNIGDEVITACKQEYQDDVKQCQVLFTNKIGMSKIKGDTVKMLVNVTYRKHHNMTYPFIFDCPLQMSNHGLRMMLIRIAVVRKAGYLSKVVNKTVELEEMNENCKVVIVVAGKRRAFLYNLETMKKDWDDYWDEDREFMEARIEYHPDVGPAELKIQ